MPDMPDTVKLHSLLGDHHSHPLLYAAFAKSVRLFETSSKDAANLKIREEAEKKKGDLVLASGWRSNQYQWTQEELEGLPPVAIFNVSLHQLLLNNAGREVVRGHYGDEVDRINDHDWYEDHFRLVLNWFANLYASTEALKDFYDEMLKLGVYSMEEMLLIDEAEMACFREAGLTDRTRFWAAPDTFDFLTDAGKATVHGLKLFTDGALGARTAALSRPYTATTAAGQECGVLLYDDASLHAIVDKCLSTRKALAIHAIGDRAIRQCVTTLERSRSQLAHVPEVRLEHAQLIDLDTAQKARDLGIILSMQPNFSSDSVDYADRLDDDYCRSNNPFRMLIDQCGFVPGRDLVFGSDGMPHGPSFALQQTLFPPYPQQSVRLDEFQAAYCLPENQSPEASITMAVENGQIGEPKVHCDLIS